jgi:hypothetical protein
MFIRDMRQFSDENPLIKTILDVLEERVNSLLESAKKAPKEVLKKAELEHLLQPA